MSEIENESELTEGHSRNGGGCSQQQANPDRFLYE
jgi:hypothetical protein